MKKLTAALLTGLLVLTMAGPGSAEPVGAKPGPLFWVKCLVTTREANIDPIMAFGENSEHPHVFFGTKVRSTDTGATLRARGRSNCEVPGDTSGWWMPTVRDANGNLLTPDDVLVYYRKAGHGRTVPFPQGLAQVSSQVIYSCGRKTEIGSEFRYCPAPTSPRMIVIFAPVPGDPNFPEVRLDVRWTSQMDVDASTWVTASDAHGVARHACQRRSKPERFPPVEN